MSNCAYLSPYTYTCLPAPICLPTCLFVPTCAYMRLPVSISTYPSLCLPPAYARFPCVPTASNHLFVVATMLVIVPRY